MNENILKEFKACADEALATHHLKFFKTGCGEYGEGCKFLGLSNPQVRAFVKKYYKELSLLETETLLQNCYHEIRLFALLVLVEKYKHGDFILKDEIVSMYLNNTEYINNWDLVDLSSYFILGDYYFDKDKSVIYDLSNSGFLWEERIAIVSTMTFVKRGLFKPTIDLCEKFLTHKHDLIHKACGWLLREVGKKDEKELLSFLDKYSSSMPRTMLRYSIEKLSSTKRKYYMGK